MNHDGAGRKSQKDALNSVKLSRSLIEDEDIDASFALTAEAAHLWEHHWYGSLFQWASHLATREISLGT